MAPHIKRRSWLCVVAGTLQGLSCITRIFRRHSFIVQSSFYHCDLSLLWTFLWAWLSCCAVNTFGELQLIGVYRHKHTSAKQFSGIFVNLVGICSYICICSLLLTSEIPRKPLSGFPLFHVLFSFYWNASKKLIGIFY